MIYHLFQRKPYQTQDISIFKKGTCYKPEGKDIWTQCTNGIDAFVSKRCLRGFDVTLDCVYIYTRNADFETV